MRARMLPSLLLLGALGGCPRSQAPNTDTPPSQSSAPLTQTINGDPWARALAIAETTHASGLARWRDDLPYLFQAHGTRGVLVHNGAVVSARGPAAAAAYLRDEGILDGKGPSQHSLLTLLYVLHAFPVVEDLPEESAIDTLGPPDLQPRIERANGHARIVLYYALPTGPGPSRGTRPLMRETLDIGPSGDPRWVGERIEQPMP